MSDPVKTAVKYPTTFIGHIELIYKEAEEADKVNRQKKGVMICLDCGHKTEASDTDIHELLSLDVVHTPCHRAEKANRGRMVRVTETPSIDVPTEKAVKQ